MQAKNISLTQLANNSGQIEGLPKNPRLIKDDRYKKLVQSIKDDPEMLELRELIVVPQDKKFVVIAGNMRLKALQELGYKEAPCKILPKETPVEKLKAFTIKDNIGYGSDDWDALANEWDFDRLQEWGMEIPGFAMKGEAAEDDFEMPDEVKTDIVAGDVFEIGPHRLVCGDNTDPANLAKLFGNNKADVVFTDPPYGVSIGKKNVMLNSFQKAGRNLTDIKDDDLKPSDLMPVLLLAFKNLKNHCADHATYFVTAPQGGELGMMMMMMKEAGLPVRHVLIWKKNSPTFSMGKLDYDYQHEPIMLTWDKKHKYYGAGKCKTSVWEIDKPRANKEHPTMKPVELVGNALLNNSKEGDISCDIYLGSGTTMVASHQLGRKCYGMEIDPKYCQVIIDRMRKLDPDIVVRKNGKILSEA